MQSTSLLLAGMAAAAFIAYQYTIFSPAGAASQQQKTIDLDEALTLLALFCIGLLAMSWRLVLSKRHEMTRRIAAERQVRELAHRDSLTELPNRHQFDGELKAAIEFRPA
jgi:predicted signal transduction protein with EAL and GGDEF domain